MASFANLNATVDNVANRRADNPSMIYSTHPNTSIESTPNIAKPKITSPAKLTDLPEKLLEQIFKAVLPRYKVWDDEQLHNYIAISMTSKQPHRILQPVATLEYSGIMKFMRNWFVRQY
jgi:hypothetical protein